MDINIYYQILYEKNDLKYNSMGENNFTQAFHVHFFFLYIKGVTTFCYRHRLDK